MKGERKMQIYKAKTTAIIITVLLMASIMLMAMPVQPVKAQISLTPEVARLYPEQIRDAGGSTAVPAGVTPDLTLDSISYISFRPTTVGTGQSFLVNIWVQPPLHASR
jgi:hypothetical protein